MHSEILFEITTPLNVTVRITKEYWNYLVTIKHRVMKNREETVIKVLSEPHTIRKSKIDENVFLYINRKIGYTVL
jgi:hypothetical protein